MAKPEEQPKPYHILPYQEKPVYGPFLGMLGEGLTELNKLPQTRTEQDLHENIVYLQSNSPAVLVAISRRRPLADQLPDRRSKVDHYGYFVDVFDIGEYEIPQFSVSERKEEILDGEFRRVYVSDVDWGAETDSTPQGEHPYKIVGLPPTDFKDYFRGAFARQFQNLRRALPDSNVQIGEVGRIFRELQEFEATKRFSVARKANVAEELANRYFLKPGIQAVPEGAHADALIISCGEDNWIAKAAKDLSIEPHIIPYWQATNLRVLQGDFPDLEIPLSEEQRQHFTPEPIEEFVYEHEFYPFVTIADFATLGMGDRDRSRFGTHSNIHRTLRDALKQHPLFAIIEVWKEGPREPILRSMHGHYEVYRPDETTLKGLLQKVGTDFYFTKLVRDNIVPFIPA